MTVDELARRAGTTTRNLRALQTRGVLVRPLVIGRTAHYGDAHLARLESVIDLQRQGFSITSIRVLFCAFESGRSLAQVLGVEPPGPADDTGLHTARRGAALSLVPTTVWPVAG
jgi:DNA-binding transcriptional MerR regulator